MKDDFMSESTCDNCIYYYDGKYCLKIAKKRLRALKKMGLWKSAIKKKGR